MIYISCFLLRFVLGLGMVTPMFAVITEKNSAKNVLHGAVVKRTQDVPQYYSSSIEKLNAMLVEKD